MIIGINNFNIELHKLLEKHEKYLTINLSRAVIFHDYKLVCSSEYEIWNSDKIRIEKKFNNSMQV